MTIVHGYVKLPEGKPTNIYLGSPKLLLSPGKQLWNWRKTTSMGPLRHSRRCKYGGFGGTTWDEV